MGNKLSKTNFWIKVEEKNGPAIIKFLETVAENQAHLEGINTEGYYGVENGLVTQANSLNISYYPVYTLEQAKLLIQGKIIGYKLKNHELAPKIRNLTNLSLDFNKLETSVKDYSVFIHELKELDLLDLWFEPVYEEVNYDVPLDMGEFEITVKPSGIFYGNEDITSFVGTMVGIVGPVAKCKVFDKWPVEFDTITFKQTGCKQATTTFAKWDKAWGIYQLLQKN